MKNKEFKSLKNRVTFIACLKTVLYSFIIVLIILLLVDGFLNDVIADWIHKSDSNLYYFLVYHKSLVIDLIFALVFSIVSFFVYRNMNNSLVEVVKSLDKVLSDDEDQIKLSDNLSIIERKLNDVKLNLIASKNSEKEAIIKKNDLIMYMAHDLKTPLTSVIGYLNLLKDEVNISPSVRDKYVSIALDKALRLEELTNQFFEITRFNLSHLIIDKSSINLSLLLNQVIDESYPMAQEKEITFNTVKDDSIVVMGDGDKLARAFGNLIKNAISYSYSKSVIDIFVEVNSENIVLYFRNRGDKIPDYKLTKIFDKFYRADESRSSSTGGTGLGLAITKEIILLHGGSIEAFNGEDYIEFKVTIPK